MKLKGLQRIALYIFFFSINFEVWDPFNVSFSISRMTGLFYLLTVLPNLSYFIRLSLLKRFVTPILIFFMLLTLMSLFNVNYISSSFFDFSIFQNIILFILLVNHERKEEGILERGMFCFALGSICLAILYKMGIGISVVDLRVTIFDDNQNSVGMRMAISIIILIWIVAKNNLNFKKWRFLLCFSFPLMLKLMADTGSRVAFISFALMILVGIVLYKTKRNSIASKIFIFIVGIGLAFLFWNYLSSSQVLIDRLQRVQEGSDLGGRTEIWENLGPFILDNLFFGRGETGYTLYSVETMGVRWSPHNVIFEVLSYTGVVGLFFYLLFCFRVFKVCFKRYKFSGSLIQFLLLIPFMGLLLSGQLLVVKIGWVIMAFGASNILYLYYHSGKEILKKV